LSQLPKWYFIACVIANDMTATNAKSSATPASQTKIVIDLADELTAEEIAEFEKSAQAAGAENLTEHFLNLTLRQETSAA